MKWYLSIILPFSLSLFVLMGCDRQKQNNHKDQLLFFNICGNPADPCPLSTFNSTAPYRILVFGSLEPDINQTIADFLNSASDISAVATANDNCLNDQLLSHFNVVVDYDHNGMSPEQAAALQRFATAGGKIIALHHSIFEPCGPIETLRDLFGAYLPQFILGSLIDEFIQGPYRVIMTRPGDPVFNGLATTGTAHYSSALVPEGDYPYYDLPVSDERYLKIIFTTPADITVLLSTTFNYVNFDIGWKLTRGAGVIYYYQMGHLREMFTVPWYQQLILNTVRISY